LFGYHKFFNQEELVKIEVQKKFVSMVFKLEHIMRDSDEKIENMFYELLDKCGGGTGAAWAMYDHQTHILKYHKVYANNPYMPYGMNIFDTTRMPGNKYYSEPQFFDSLAEAVLNKAPSTGYIIIDVMNDKIWGDSPAFRRLKNNWWKITNDDLFNKNLPIITPKKLYIAVARQDDSIKYVFALTLSGNKSYCNLDSIVESPSEKEYKTGMFLNRISNESLKIFEVNNY
jgi:hypothetical protein